MKEMVEVKSPVRFKDLEGKFGISLKGFMAKGSKKELSDTDKVIAIKLEKEECIVLIDANDSFWELCRNKKGRHSMKRLDDRHQEGLIDLWRRNSRNQKST